MSEILEGKLKIEHLARISSTSVSTPLPVISPRELLWRDISLLQVSKGTKSWTFFVFNSLNRIGHQLAVKMSNFSPSSDSSTNDAEQMSQFQQK